jgi:hypothetical protein
MILSEASVFPKSYKRGVREFQSLMHMKLGVDDPTFDNGDDVSISVLPLDPTIQTRTIGVQWLYKEEGNDDDDIQSKDEVINAHYGSDDDDDAHIPKVEIASHIVRNYYCAFHGKHSACNFASWYCAFHGKHNLY